MQVIHLDDPCDERLRRYSDLRQQSAEHDPNTFVVEGRWCIQRMISSAVEICSIVVQQGKEHEVIGWLGRPVPIYSLSPEDIRSLVGFDFHRGMLASGIRPAMLDVETLRFQPNAAAVALAVMGVDHQENLGSMMRTAAALGIEHLLIGPKTADPYARRTIRVSMATVFGLKLYQLDQPVEQLQRVVQSLGCRTMVATLDPAATSLHQLRLDDSATILVVGNESTGVDASIERIATDRVTLPMNLGTDSLNVSIAAAIFMYELTRRTR